MIPRRPIVALFFAISLCVGSSYTVLAHNGETHGDLKGATAETKQKVQELRSGVKTDAEKKIDKILQDVKDKNSKLKEKVTAPTPSPNVQPKKTSQRENALETCKNRQAQINMTIDSITTRNQQRYDKITSIYDKTIAYYEASGRVVKNYSSLVAAVETQKQTALAGISSIKPVGGFNCSSMTPRQALADLKVNRQASVNHLIAYRDSVKAVISAIKASTKVATSDVN